MDDMSLLSDNLSSNLWVICHIPDWWLRKWLGPASLGFCWRKSIKHLINSAPSNYPTKCWHVIDWTPWEKSVTLIYINNFPFKEHNLKIATAKLHLMYFYPYRAEDATNIFQPVYAMPRILRSVHVFTVFKLYGIHCTAMFLSQHISIQVTQTSTETLSSWLTHKCVIRPPRVNSPGSSAAYICASKLVLRIRC